MHTYMTPKNKIKDRPDRRLAESQNSNKCVILVLRERHALQSVEDAISRMRGARRTCTFILPSENESDIRSVSQANVAPNARIYSDEVPGYTTLSTHWDHQVVNHSKEYCADNGANENQAESYISRFRRMMIGQIHWLSRKYLDVYPNEVAFREDHRRRPNGDIVSEILEKCLRSLPSRDWSNYWQGNRRQHDSVLSH